MIAILVGQPDDPRADRVSAFTGLGEDQVAPVDVVAGPSVESPELASLGTTSTRERRRWRLPSARVHGVGG